MRRSSARRSFEVPRQQNQRRSQQRDDTEHMEAVHEGKQACLLLQLLVVVQIRSTRGVSVAETVRLQIRCSLPHSVLQRG